MIIIEKVQEMQWQSREWKIVGHRVACIPTMGALHEGHLSLIRLARQHASRVILTIFVNPTQFGPKEDFDKYPKALEQDLALAEREGVDAVFLPSIEEIYPDGAETFVEITELSKGLCGDARPGHFRGVATVVLKLFRATLPHIAVFGEKDYQQLQIITKMIRDLFLNIKIISAPTVREPDGLAMSSRNQYLSLEERRAATTLYRSLKHAQMMVREGARDATLIQRYAQEVIESEPLCSLEYISICHYQTLKKVYKLDGKVLLALAVRIGKTRLIDNSQLDPYE